MSAKNSILVSILKYASYFAVYYLIRTPVHERIHLYVGCLFGGEGYIKLALWGATTVFIEGGEKTIQSLSTLISKLRKIFVIMNEGF